MGGASLSIAGSANSHGERSCPPGGTNVRTKKMTAEIIKLATDFFGSRKVIAHAAGCCIRTIANWKNGERTVAFEEFLNLLEDPRGAEFFEVFWQQVPEHTRERWIKGEMLRRRLADRALERDREDREIEQLRMELSKR